MRITQVRIASVKRLDGSNLVGCAEITIEDCFCVRDLKIFRRPSGYNIVMSQAKLNNGKYEEIASAINAKTRKMIERAVIAEY